MSRKIVPLMQFVPRVTPRYTEPRHLAPLAALFDRVARGEEVEACVSVPPRHEKTDTILHGGAWLMKQRPMLRAIYCSYASAIAERKSKRWRAIAERARVPLDPTVASAAHWATGVEDGSLLATGVDGQIVGEGADLIFVDDPVKNRVEAESALARDRLYDWFRDVLYTRKEPGGSVIVVMHRWHEDDLIGRLVGDGWEWINLPALDDEGNALCPERFTADRLHKIRERMGDYGFDGLYLGRPRPRGGRLFVDVVHYDDVPEGLEVSIGVDFAYTIKTHADYSVAVVLGFERATGRYFVVDVVRLQVTAPTFRATLEGLSGTYPRAPMTSYIGGTERAVIDLFGEQGLCINARAAVADKFTRAQPASAAWNAGKILLPRKARWLEAFVSEICGFTGIGDRHDDQVDALVGAFDGARALHDASHLRNASAFGTQDFEDMPLGSYEEIAAMQPRDTTGELTGSFLPGAMPHISRFGR